MKRLLDQGTLRAMARGCAVLGAGGGGDTYYALLQALQAAEDFGPAALVDVDELPGDGLIMPCGGVGAPLVGLEKIEAGDEGERLRNLLERQTGQTVTALMAGEIGGSNGLVPVTWAAQMGLPVVDADGMGRAFPLVSQVTMQLAGISPCPAVMTDERGNVVVFRAISGDWVERLERAAAAEFGGMGSATADRGAGTRGDGARLGIAGDQDRRGGGELTRQPGGGGDRGRRSLPARRRQGAGRLQGRVRRVYARLGGHRGPGRGRGTAYPAGTAE
jgi:DUF917 family protein